MKQHSLALVAVAVAGCAATLNTIQVTDRVRAPIRLVEAACLDDYSGGPLPQHASLESGTFLTDESGAVYGIECTIADFNGTVRDGHFVASLTRTDNKPNILKLREYLTQQFNEKYPRS